MPKISESRREERRSDIMQAALRCFLRAGYQQTSMADIIAESGLSAGAIYSYFPSKQALIRGVATQVLGERRAVVEAATAEHPLSPSEIVTLLINGVRAHAPAQAIVQVWSEATVDSDLRAHIQGMIGDMRGTITGALTRWGAAHPEALPAGQAPASWAAATSATLIGLLPGFMLQRALVGDFDEEGYLLGIRLLLRD
ncbi:TetR/AcrR family transcriptional regulator [Microbacterium istanbulense]|uniref:TetR/AcrR family transcriptional regulator n=1 Tax=Microbacterium istanbulense TaxID=3122049 RepID=A0ABU8LFX4_9MICO